MSSRLRLDRLLSNLGYGSRKDAAFWAKEGMILRDGEPVWKADASVDLDEVRSGRWTLDGEPLDPPSPLTLMVNKPKGYISSHDERGMLVHDLLSSRWRQRKPQLSLAGRLDKDSTGQIILTDDGQLLHKIIHPRSHAAKHYAVTLEKPLRGDEGTLFASGGFLMQGDDKPLKPAVWQPDGPQSGTMQLTEGRFHQIRRMFRTLGNEVVALHRFQTGGLPLGDLPEGEFRILNEADLALLFSPAAP